jgi:hypothetical protein
MKPKFRGKPYSHLGKSNEEDGIHLSRHARKNSLLAMKAGCPVGSVPPPPKKAPFSGETLVEYVTAYFFGPQMCM